MSKKIGVAIRNSGFVRWANSLGKHFKKNIKVGYKGIQDPDEVTGDRKRKEFLSKTKDEDGRFKK